MNNKRNIFILLILVFVVFAILFVNNTGDLKTSNNDKTQTIIDNNEPKVEIVEKEEGSYEEWLASAMILALSLEGDEFEVKHIYLLSDTSLNNKLNSEGVFLEYVCHNELNYLVSVPLEREREEKGKIDLYTKDIGFSTFDNVNHEFLNNKTYREVDVNSLTEFIKQSMLVSLYEN